MHCRWKKITETSVFSESVSNCGQKSLPRSRRKAENCSACEICRTPAGTCRNDQSNCLLCISFLWVLASVFKKLHLVQTFCLFLQRLPSSTPFLPPHTDTQTQTARTHTHPTAMLSWKATLCLPFATKLSSLLESLIVSGGWLLTS